MKQFLQYGCWITIGLTALLWFYIMLCNWILNTTADAWCYVAAAGMFGINQGFTWTLFFTQGGPEAIRKLRKKL